MGFIQTNTNNTNLREFNEFLEAQMVFEDDNQDSEYRLKALDYIIKHNEITYLLKTIQKKFMDYNINNNIYIDYIFTTFPKLIKRDEDFLEIFKFLNSNNAYLRSQTMQFLQEVGEKVQWLIKKLLDDKDKDIRISALNILGDIRFEDSIDMLRYLLTKESAQETPDINVLMTAVDYIGEIGTKDDIELLNAIKKQFANEPYVQFGIDTAINRIEK